MQLLSQLEQSIKIGVPGEQELEDVECYCAVCDGAFFKINVFS